MDSYSNLILFITLVAFMGTAPLPSLFDSTSHLNNTLITMTELNAPLHDYEEYGDHLTIPNQDTTGSIPANASYWAKHKIQPSRQSLYRWL